jgi:hypothetical protein
MLKHVGLAAVLLAATFSLPALAGGDNGNNGNGNQCQGNSCGGGGGSNRGAPGPIAGAGLPFLLIAGGYVLVRRYRNRSKVEQL